MLSNLLLVLTAFVISLIVTPVIGQVANKLNVVDRPGGRHQHTRVVPKLGGVAIFVAFVSVAIAKFGLPQELLFVLIIGSLFLLIGILDDAFSISFYSKLLAQLAAASLLVMSGIGIQTVGNPWTTALITLGGLSAMLTVLWIVTLVNVVNLTDGIDGLVSGLSLIAAVVLALLSFKTGHPNVGYLALILSGALAGFLVYNFHPAKIFLGDSGTMFVGFMLAVLGFLGGAKIATAILVLGVPILDGGLIILYRAATRSPVYQGDRNHLHFRLLDQGMTQVKICFLLYSISTFLGILALIVPGREKMLTLLVLSISFVIGWSLLWRYEKRLK